MCAKGSWKQSEMRSSISILQEVENNLDIIFLKIQ